MIEESAVVLEVYDREVLVKVQANQACDTCQARGACGQGLLSKYFKQDPGQLLLKKALPTGETIDLKPGDQILLGVEEGAVLQGAFLAYMVPLLFVLTFAALAQLFTIQSEIKQLLFVGIGLLFGISVVKLLVDSRFMGLKNIMPVILKPVIEGVRIPIVNKV